MGNFYRSLRKEVNIEWFCGKGVFALLFQGFMIQTSGHGMIMGKKIPKKLNTIIISTEV